MCLQVMAHHTLACYAVVIATSGAIKKTTSGKVQRRACRAAFEHGEYSEVKLLSQHHLLKAPPALSAAVPALYIFSRLGDVLHRVSSCSVYQWQ